MLDPRYPEARAYLVDVYRRALRDWGIDGFKLDFIERLVADDKTVLDATGGRDFASVNEAADRMMTDVLAELRQVKPDVMIEFRQPYIGPLIRKYGNMFRASDCPNSYLANRVKTVDLRLLTGDTAVHADMIMWHPSEPVERAAFQLLNVMFSVPQVSVRLQEIPKDHFEMVRFYTDYWRRNRAVLLDGAFEALSPNANYPVRRGASAAASRSSASTRTRSSGSTAARPTPSTSLNAKSSKRVVLDVRARPRPLSLHRARQPGTDRRRGRGRARGRRARVHGSGVGPAQPRACGRAPLAGSGHIPARVVRCRQHLKYLLKRLGPDRVPRSSPE